jgi:hypothetical protein|eukprot:COSAG06_NODE_6572_length_2875_cov_1.938761_4_plen_108_part_00
MRLPPMLFVGPLMCGLLVASAGASGGAKWIETSNIKWCSGGGDWKAGTDPFGGGSDPGSCPIVLTNWTMAESVAACEKLCEPAAECLGFTWCGRAVPAAKHCRPPAS